MRATLRLANIWCAGLLVTSCGAALPDLPAAVPGTLPFDGTYVGMTDEQARLAGRIAAAVTAECMRRAGFEFVIETPAPVGPDLPGWGISTGYGQEAGTAAEGAARPGTNEAIFEALGPEQRDAYERALHGDFTDRVVLDSPDGGQVSYAGPNSCIGQGNIAAFGDREKVLLAQEEILLAYGDLEDRIQSDSRLVETMDAWSVCMEESGYTFETPEDPAVLISQRLAELESMRLTPDPAALSVDTATGTYRENAKMSPELAALQKEEVRLYELTAACDRRVGLSDMRKRVRYAYEVPFAEEHADLVEDLQLPNLDSSG